MFFLNACRLLREGLENIVRIIYLKYSFAANLEKNQEFTVHPEFLIYLWQS